MEWVGEGLGAEKPGSVEVPDKLTDRLVEMGEPGLIQPMAMVVSRKALEMDDIAMRPKTHRGVNGSKACVHRPPADAGLRISQQDIEREMNGIGKPGSLPDRGKFTYLLRARVV